MKLSQFIGRIVEGSRIAVHTAYRHDESKWTGAMAGLEACWDMTPSQLLILLDAAKIAQARAEKLDHNRVEEIRAFRYEVEWVCDCVSVVLLNQGQTPLIEPSVNAYAKVADIVGVDS